jgi:hypothetical protein
MWSAIGGASQFRITLGSAPAQTSITGGLRDTSNQADGNRYFIVTDNAATIDTGNKRVTQASALGAILFAVGIDYNGTSATVGDDYIAGYNEFFVQGSETLVVTAL